MYVNSIQSYTVIQKLQFSLIWKSHFSAPVVNFRSYRNQSLISFVKIILIYIYLQYQCVLFRHERYVVTVAAG